MPKPCGADSRSSSTSLRLAVTESSRCHAQPATADDEFSDSDATASKTADARRAKPWRH